MSKEGEPRRSDENNYDQVRKTIVGQLQQVIQSDREKRKPFSILAVVDNLDERGVVNGVNIDSFRGISPEHANEVMRSLQESYPDNSAIITELPVFINLSAWYAFPLGYTPDSTWLKKIERFKETARFLSHVRKHQKTAQ